MFDLHTRQTDCTKMNLARYKQAILRGDNPNARHVRESRCKKSNGIGTNDFTEEKILPNSLYLFTFYFTFDFICKAFSAARL